MVVGPMSVLSTIEEFEAALDALRAAFARQLADDAATIQSLLREQGDMRAAVERGVELETAMEASTSGVLALSERAAKAEAALAKVTAERGEARLKAEIRLNAIESMRRAALRATPTEGDLPIEPTDTPKGGA